MSHKKSESFVSSVIDKCESGVMKDVRKRIGPNSIVDIELTLEIKNRFDELRSQIGDTLSGDEKHNHILSQEINPPSFKCEGIGVRMLRRIQQYFGEDTPLTWGDLLALYKSGDLENIAGIDWIRVGKIGSHLCQLGILDSKDVLISSGGLFSTIYKKIQRYLYKTNVTAGELLVLYKNKKLRDAGLTPDEISEIRHYLRERVRVL